jgi:hypothetical protein
MKISVLPTPFAANGTEVKRRGARRNDFQTHMTTANGTGERV